jgi:acetyltransferase-like isoleucine patch superfamily enzyme
VSFKVQVLGKARKALEAAHARVALRRCTEVGPLTRVVGRVIVVNHGSIRLGSRVRLTGRPVPIELAALEGASLVVGDGTGMNRGVSICAANSISIGRRCGIGNDCLIIDTDFHQVGDHSQTQPGDAAPIVIGDKVWLAARTVVLKGVTIGEGAVACAGSVIATSVPPYTMVGGSPARVIKRLEAPGAAPSAVPMAESSAQVAERL